MTKIKQKHKYSEKYRLLCRFLKETNLYFDFLEYQKSRSSCLIREESETIITELGKTNFTVWLELYKNKNPKDNIFWHFRRWLYAFYPNVDCDEDYASIQLSDAELKAFGIDKEKRQIKIQYYE